MSDIRAKLKLLRAYELPLEISPCDMCADYHGTSSVGSDGKVESTSCMDHCKKIADWKHKKLLDESIHKHADVWKALADL